MRAALGEGPHLELGELADLLIGRRSARRAQDGRQVALGASERAAAASLAVWMKPRITSRVHRLRQEPASPQAPRAHGP